MTEALRRQLDEATRARDRAVLRVRLAHLAGEIRATMKPAGRPGAGPDPGPRAPRLDDGAG